jgi:hypothetical protein
MMRCRNCAWFHRPRGRTPTTCRDVGEEPGNEACPQFEVEEPEPSVPDPPAAVGALLHQNYRDIFHEVLAESFTLEQDAKVAVDTVRAQLQAQGANISVDPASFNRQAGRLVDLYVLYRLALAVGLSRYVDRIMEMEIARIFRDRDKPKTPMRVPV